MVTVADLFLSLYRRKSRLFSSISRQLAAPPMRVFAIGIELTFDVAVQRLQGGNAGELDRATMFGSKRQ